jgi:hypothetical protein
MTALSHVVEPEPGLQALLDQRFAVYGKLHEALRPHWRAAETLLTTAKTPR